MMSRITGTQSPSQVPHLAEAALGCFKDEMLHLLTRKRMGLELHQFAGSSPVNTASTYVKHEEKDETIQKIKYGLSRAIKDTDELPLPNKTWETTGGTSSNFSGAFPTPDAEFHYELPSLGDDGDASPWGQNMCTETSLISGDQQVIRLNKQSDNEIIEDSDGLRGTREASEIFNAECVLWDLQTEDLMNPIV